MIILLKFKTHAVVLRTEPNVSNTPVPLPKFIELSPPTIVVVPKYEKSDIAEHPLQKPSPRPLTEAVIVSEANLVQFLKACVPTLPILDGILIAVNAEHCSNALSPIDEMVAGMVILDSEEHPVNAL